MKIFNNSPLVGVCLLSYNDEAYVGQAIQDLLGQDYHNIELIISDDCSTDRSPYIIQEFAKQDKRIRFFLHTTRLGMQENYNFLLSEAKGEYFMWASSDDRWAPNYLSTLLDIFKDNPGATSAAAPFLFIKSDCQSVEGFSEPQNYHPLNDYESKFASVRLIKFAFYYFDDFFYGLHKRSSTEKLRVPVWWGLNKKVAWNNNYPVQAYFLARGQYVRAKGPPLFYKRLPTPTGHRHSYVVYRYRYYIAIAFICRKINVWIETLRSIHLGSESMMLVFYVAPFYLIRCLADCSKYIMGLIKRCVRVPPFTNCH